MTFRTMQLLLYICLIVFAADARADCYRSALAHQRRDAATIQRLESAWTLAYLLWNLPIHFHEYFSRRTKTLDFLERRMNTDQKPAIDKSNALNTHSRIQLPANLILRIFHQDDLILVQHR